MSDNEDRGRLSAQADNLGMTPEQRTLQEMIIAVGGSYIAANDGKITDAESDHKEQIVIAYVDSLLAAKDAEIARLEARQITPEMMTVWGRLQEMRRTQSARYVANNKSALKDDLWRAFEKTMEDDA